jgi:hypothetical protein
MARMAKPFDTWTVVPHKPLEKLAANLWRVEGDIPGADGTRVMTIAKRKDGGLVIHNGIALEEDLMKEIEAFGDPAVLVVPNGFHRLDARVYKARYPKMRVVCPGAAAKKVGQVVAVDGSYDDAGKDDDVMLMHLEGTKAQEGVMRVRSDDGTSLVFNDCINNLPKLGGLFGFLLAPTGRPSVPRIARWMMVKDKPAFRADIEKLAGGEGLARVIVSHGAVMDGAKLRAAVSDLS